MNIFTFIALFASCEDLLMLSGSREIFDEPGDTALIRAVRRNDYQKVVDLLSIGVDPNKTDSYGILPVAYAINLNNIDIVSVLLEHGSKVTESPILVPYMIRAALHGNRKMIDILLKTGLKVDSEFYYCTPLLAAIFVNDPIMMEQLLLAGANPNYMIHKDLYPLTKAQDPIIHDILIRFGAFLY